MFRTIGAGSQSRGAARDLSLAVDTWDAMNDGVAVIDQGVLWDPEHRTYGLPDLLVRSDVLAGLFPGALSSQDAAVEAPDLDIGGCHYVVVDIKYTTLRFTAKGKLSNSRSSPAYKVQVHIYNRALARLQGYVAPRAFLLGRGWEQTVGGATTRVGDCADRLASVEHNEETRGGVLSKLADEAATWMRPYAALRWWLGCVAGAVGGRTSSRRGWRSWSVGGCCQRDRGQGGDLTALFGVGVDGRREANAKGLTDWRDERVTPKSLGVKGATKVPRLKALLDVNREAGPVGAPGTDQRSPIRVDRNAAAGVLRRFRDGERHQRRLLRHPSQRRAAAGVHGRLRHVEGGKWSFECFVAEQLTETAEAAAIEQWLNHMNSVRDRLDSGSRPRVIHWSAHEVSSLTTAYNAAAERHASRAKHWPEPRWFDFLTQVIRPEPVVVRGAHGFGLKAITNALHTEGLVETRWSTGPTDGLGAMVGAWWVPTRG